MHEPQKALNFIGGEFIGAASGATFSRFNPSTGQALSEVAKSETLDLVRAVQGANKAWAFWSKIEPEGRAAILHALAQSIEEKVEDFALLESSETGVPISVSRASVQRSAQILEFYSRTLREHHREASQPQGFLESREPIGVIGIITSWVEPVWGMASRVGAALAAGNVVILKPSSRAPLTAQAFAKAFADTVRLHQQRTPDLPAGFSAGFLSVVQGRGVDVGEALVCHPGISTLAFIGKTETGRKIQIAAAEFLKRVQLSLSGCNSILVFADCDLSQTVERVIELSLTSETSAAIRGMRIFVQDPVYKEFARLLTERVAQIQIGTATEKQTRLGPLPGDAERRQFFDAVTKAIGENGKLLFGGIAPMADRPEGYFVRPTAIMDLTNCSTLHQEEIIGPFVLISSFKYQMDAIKYANGSPFGQVCYLFHRDAEKAARIAGKIQAGRVFTNLETGLIPWSPEHSAEGMKFSALGSVEGRAGLAFFSRSRLVFVDDSGAMLRG